MCVTQIGTRHFIRRRQNKDKGFMPRLSDVRFFRASLRMTCQELSTPSKSRVWKRVIRSTSKAKSAGVATF
ncbi:unnamed protein product [Effrenium voratum]|nr:unnamed protein product [Effrenium voratum]